MLRIITLLIVLLCQSFTVSFAAEYQPGWDYFNFYKAVQTCREAIVYPQIKAYEKKGLEKHQNQNQLHNELISISPLFDTMATSVCFCAVNEAAKSNSLNQFSSGRDARRYMQMPKCKSVLKESLNIIKTQAQALKLN
ncbi:MAG: hypothetical protein PF441_03270 [Desulfuromusa sp.]|jgi:hypothetical protein|nr:hypothetical protein [Desulfuromusa sp.]